MEINKFKGDEFKIGNTVKVMYFTVKLDEKGEAWKEIIWLQGTIINMMEGGSADILMLDPETGEFKIKHTDYGYYKLI
jgi:hypothetical protein